MWEIFRKVIDSLRAQKIKYILNLYTVSGSYIKENNSMRVADEVNFIDAIKAVDEEAAINHYKDFFENHPYITFISKPPFTCQLIFSEIELNNEPVIFVRNVKVEKKRIRSKYCCSPKVKKKKKVKKK